MNSMSAAEQAGITYRQLDHWIRRGYIKGALPGSGVQRDLNGHEVDVLRIMADLVGVVGMKPAAAAPVARTMAEGKGVAIGSYVITRVAS